MFWHILIAPKDEVLWLFGYYCKALINYSWPLLAWRLISFPSLTNSQISDAVDTVRKPSCVTQPEVHYPHHHHHTCSITCCLCVLLQRMELRVSNSHHPPLVDIQEIVDSFKCLYTP